MACRGQVLAALLASKKPHEPSEPALHASAVEPRLHPVTNVARESEQETVEGYVVDIACLRKYPRSEWLERARAHTQQCALMGHCVESGYGLVDDGRVALLDDDATPRVVNALQSSSRKSGIRLRATRRMADQHMQTFKVEEVA